MWIATWKRTNDGRIGQTLEETSQLALGIKQRKVPRRSIVKKIDKLTSWNSDRL